MGQRGTRAVCPLWLNDGEQGGGWGGAKVVWEEEGKRRTLRLAVSTSYSRNRRCEPTAWRREPWAEAVVALAAVWYGRGLSAVVQTVRLTGGPHAV
jgi:hypothetical protein